MTLGTVAGGDIPAADITNFSFTDGFGVDITQANDVDLLVDLTTNGSGTPTAWLIQASAYINSSIPTTFACAESTAGTYAPCGSILTDVSSSFVSGESYDENGYAENFGANGAAGTLQISGPNVTAPEPSSLILLGVGLLGLYSARTLWTNWTAIDPSPTAAATRFMLPDRTSPTAKTPGRLVSSK